MKKVLKLLVGFYDVYEQNKEEKLIEEVAEVLIKLNKIRKDIKTIREAL